MRYLLAFSVRDPDRCRYIASNNSTVLHFLEMLYPGNSFDLTHTHNIHKRSQVWSPALWSKTKHFYVPQLMIYMPTKNEMKSTQQYLFVYLFFRIFFSPPLTLSNVALLPNNRILRILKMFYSRMSPLSQSVETNIFF